MSLGRVEEVNIDTAKLSTTSETTEVKTACADPIHEKDVATGNGVTAKERQDLLKLLNQHRECFATNIEELGCTNLTEMDIVLKEGSTPVSSRPYRTSKEERETMQKIVSEWKAAGIATESRSPYASPVLLVRKENGEPRLVVDYRKLNAKTVKDKYPLPLIDDAVEQLAGSKLFTTVDLVHGFLPIPLKESAKEKTAFVTPDGTWNFERFIFGLSNGPTEFQRLMNTALGNLRNTIAACYFDDILVPANNFEEMLEKLTKVLRALRDAGLALRLSKCRFADNRVEYLGFVIGEGGVRPGSDKVRAIDEFSVPKDLHEVKRFLGLTSFFRRFVPRYAALSEPLSRLTRKREAFHWDQDQEDAFQALKSALTSHPVLQVYSTKARTEAHIDACANGLAGILLQADENDVLHPVYYVSKKTSPAERFYHSSKLELLAIVWTVERLRPFLVGIEFTLVTDCQALVYLNAAKTLKPQTARWFDMLQEYTFDIRHRPGSKMEHLDAMSHTAVEDPSDPWDNVIADKLDMWMTISLHYQALIYQRSDEEVRRIATTTEKKSCDRIAEERALAQNFVLKEGRLFRETEADGKKKLLYVMPKSMRKSVCVKFHDLEGHFGLDQTLAKISETCWFPGMRRCQVEKKRDSCTPSLERRSLETIHADNLGPFVRSKKGNKYILVVIDNLAKYVKLFLPRDTSAKSVIKSCEDFTLSCGLPERIITDRGTCFTSKAFEEFCKTRDIQQVLNSTRHPRANGQVERVNRTFVPTIVTTMDGNDQREWDIGLKGVEAFLNTSHNKSTGRTSFEVFYGYNPEISRRSVA
ncbi:hypothetical protein V5799_023187 [Amblyomma americanum]|uniref:RNA-directed DNA polymerase n=1 Tax=Amblyomma americanum TaxID=6943 RepID=A0AAQ4FII4_AMBAM